MRRELEKPQMLSSTNSTDSNRELSIAVDLGGTKTSAATIFQGNIVERKQASTNQEASPEEHVRSIVELIKSFNENELGAIGVAVAGRIDHLGRWHTLNNNTLKEFFSFPLRERLESEFGRPIRVMNDAVAAAWGEYCFLSEEEKVDSFLYMTVSTGVGGGLVLNGKPLISEIGLAGHVGFMTCAQSTARCGSGRLATLESFASGTAIGRRASTTHTMTGHDVYKAHLAGEPDATTIVEQSAKAIATAIADVRSLLELKLVVIGGSVGLDEGYIELVQKFLEEEPVLFRPRLIAARRGGNSALFGVVLESPTEK